VSRPLQRSRPSEPLTSLATKQSNAEVARLSERHWVFLMCVAERIVPAAGTLDAGGRASFTAIVAKALADRPRSIQRQLALFLDLVRWAPLLRYLAPFDRLAPQRQTAVLRWLLDAPLAKLRGGFWGLRALVYMGYYGQPEVWPSIGYAPSFTGNERLHG
jgi:hypothetical protein